MDSQTFISPDAVNCQHVFGYSTPNKRPNRMCNVHSPKMVEYWNGSSILQNFPCSPRSNTEKFKFPSNISAWTKVLTHNGTILPLALLWSAFQRQFDSGRSLDPFGANEMDFDFLSLFDHDYLVEAALAPVRKPVSR